MAPIGIDLKSSIPVYLQIANHLNCIIIDRHFPTGSRLPPIRHLAADLNVNPNTVAKSYELLTRRGVIRKRRGAGCYVVDELPEVSAADRRRRIEPRLSELISEAQAAGMGLQEFIGLARELGSPVTSSSSAASAPTDSVWQPDNGFID